MNHIETIWTIVKLLQKKSIKKLKELLKYINLTWSIIILKKIIYKAVKEDIERRVDIKS